MGAASSFSDPYFLALLENSDDAVCVLDREGRIAFSNERGIGAAKKTYADPIGQLWAELWPTAGRMQAHDAVAEASEGGRTEFRAFFPKSNGEPACWSCRVTPVRDPQTGEVVGVLTVSTDITARVGESTLLKTVVEHVPAAISVKRAENGLFCLANRALADLVGFASDYIVGLTDRDIFTKAEADAFAEKDRQLLAGDQSMMVEQVTFTDPMGAERVLRNKRIVIRGSSHPTYILSVAEDITEDLEAAEALRQALAASESANRAKSEFLANMSHEIRTPLNGVMGVAGALARTPLSPDQEEMVSIIETSAKTLETLLSDILDLARIEAGKLELRPEPFDLSTSVNACAALFDAAAQAKGLELTTEIAPGAKGAYIGDAPRIRQILSNMLSNAVKFTTVGSVKLRVDAVRGETSSSLVLEVTDTGIGFDAETKARLFSRFEQADGSITRRFGGTGLGLSISRALAEAMGGTIEADAELGQGARFTLRVELPRCAGDLDLWVEDESEAEQVGHVGGLRVLVAEDHPTNRRVVELILGAADVDLSCVEDGAQAVAAYEAGEFDLILMDMQMPVMDGLTAIREIRAREAAAGRGRMPIHVLTANAMPDHVAASQAAGADGHLSKPILAKDLLDLVAEVAASRDRVAPTSRTTAAA